MKSFAELNKSAEPRQAFSARVPIPVWEEMERRKASHHGGDRTALVEAALRKHLGMELPAAEQGSEAGSSGSDSADPVQAPPRLLVDVLSDRTGNPRALCRRFIETGRVQVGGEVCRTPGLDIASVSGLAIVVDGSPV